jgi:signal transduction histidine kinase
MSNPTKERTDSAQQEQHVFSDKNIVLNIINSMPSVLIAVDANDKVSLWNDEAQRVTGIKTTAASGQKIGDVYPSLLSETEKIHDVLKTREKYTAIKRHRTLKNSFLCENITIYPISIDDHVFAVIRLDISTELMCIEEMLLRNEKMLLLDGFSTGVVRELSNPVAAIIQTVNVMKNRLTDDASPNNISAAESADSSMSDIHSFLEQRGVLRMLGNIHASGERVTGILESMLGIASQDGDHPSYKQNRAAYTLGRI